MNSAPVRVLLIEDNPGDAGLLRKALESVPSPRFHLTHVEDLTHAFTALAHAPFDVLLLDLSLPDSQGLDTFLSANAAAPEVPILVLTGLADQDLAMRTVHQGAQDYLVKGEIDDRSLTRAVCYAIERKSAERHLREVMVLQQAILDSANYAIISTDTDGIIRTFNAAAERWLGYRAEEVVGKETPMLFHDLSEVERRAQEISREDDTVVEPGFEVFVRRARAYGAEEREWTYVRRDGSSFPALLSVTPLRAPAGWITGYLGIASDITERKRAEVERQRLLASEQEKAEQLKLSVREAHHRIKNNLQAISDLLYLELHSLEPGPAREALHENIERVQAIALVHDLLSQHEDLQTADTRAVLERLVPMILRGSSHGIDLHLDVASVRLSSKRITTLALIVNELVTNAVKHAFADGRAGKLLVQLRARGEDRLLLRVRDTGPGLPAEFDLDTHAHVGLDVVRVMTERDLDGHLALTSGGGMTAEVCFPLT